MAGTRIMRPAKPWYRASQDRWYVTLHGKKVSLGVTGQGNKKAALSAWHRLSLEPPPAPKPVIVPAPLTVAKMVDDYLAEATGRVKPSTLAVLKGRLASFKKAFGKADPNAITVKQVETFMAGKTWKPSSKNGFVAALKACWKWAAASVVIPTNPLAKLVKPAGESRGAKALITLAAHRRLTAKASKPLKALLTLLWETGARPSELASLKIGDVDYGQRLAVITDHKTAHHGKPRILFLTDTALAVLREGSEGREAGYILRTVQGNRWAKNAICTAVRKLALKVEVSATAYGYRHTFATDALSKGVPDTHVAALLGHSGTAMLHRHYSHLTANSRAMREAAARIR